MKTYSVSFRHFTYVHFPVLFDVCTTSLENVADFIHTSYNSVGLFNARLVRVMNFSASLGLVLNGILIARQESHFAAANEQQREV